MVVKSEMVHNGNEAVYMSDEIGVYKVKNDDFDLRYLCTFISLQISSTMDAILLTRRLHRGRMSRIFRNYSVRVARN
jgi:hypothetical protein